MSTKKAFWKDDLKKIKNQLKNDFQIQKELNQIMNFQIETNNNKINICLIVNSDNYKFSDEVNLLKRIIFLFCELCNTDLKKYSFKFNISKQINYSYFYYSFKFKNKL